MLLRLCSLDAALPGGAGPPSPSGACSVTVVTWRLFLALSLPPLLFSVGVLDSTCGLSRMSGGRVDSHHSATRTPGATSGSSRDPGGQEKVARASGPGQVGPGPSWLRAVPWYGVEPGLIGHHCAPLCAQGWGIRVLPGITPALSPPPAPQVSGVQPCLAARSSAWPSPERSSSSPPC